MIVTIIASAHDWLLPTSLFRWSLPLVDSGIEVVVFCCLLCVVFIFSFFIPYFVFVLYGIILECILSLYNVYIVCVLMFPSSFFYLMHDRMFWCKRLITHYFVIHVLFLLNSFTHYFYNKASLDVCPSVLTYVHLSTKSLSDLNEIWCVGRGDALMHDGMPYGLIQDQGQGHVELTVRNSSILKIYLLCLFQWQLANDCWFFKYLNLSGLFWYLS